MEDIPETYDLETIEQLRAIADPLRVRIVEALALRPMTATQVGEELDEPAPKAHYHVRELERVGLVRLVETRERGGILEKYYRAVGKTMRVPPRVLQMAPPDEVAQTMDAFLSTVTGDFQTAMTRSLNAGVTNFDETALNLSGSSLWMTPQEYQNTLKQAMELFKPFSARRGVENEREISLTIISYDALLARRAGGDSPMTPPAPTPPMSPSPSTPPAPPQAPAAPNLPPSSHVSVTVENKRNPVRKVIVAGAVHFSRRELVEMAEKGEQVDITSFGVLSFANDVPAELARRTVARLSYRGVLHASESVREVLREKEKEKAPGK
jgi:DNA-binding transcriptional ArsR family regulator